MSKNVTSIYKDIINDRNLRESIPRFFELGIDKYNTYAIVRLALHYYMYYEMYLDEKGAWGHDICELINKVNNIISQALVQRELDKKSEDFIKQIDETRHEMTRRIETLCLYSDFLTLYEHASDRVGLRFSEIEDLEEDEDFARKVLRYIFEQKDNVTTNERIKEVIKHLPVRITKQKYFDYISDGFRELIGTQEDILETYIYIFRASANLEKMDDIKDLYPKLWEFKERLENLNFKEITKADYDVVIREIDEAQAMIEEEFTAYHSLAEIVNELYSILSCGPYADIDKTTDKVDEAGLYIIASISDLFLKDKQEEPSEDIISRFEVIEGYQEEMEYELLSIDDALYHIDNRHEGLVEELEVEDRLKALLTSRDLLSDSLFIDLNKKKTNGLVDKDTIDKEINKLIRELTDKFKGLDRNIIRAIMANTMDKVPVFLNNHTEVMEYVLYSLSKCSDPAEKYACMIKINDIIND